MTTFLHYLKPGAEPPTSFPAPRKTGPGPNDYWTNKQSAAALTNHPKLLAELRMEEIFERHKPDGAPSRMECLYLFDTVSGVEGYARVMRICPTLQKRVKVRALPGSQWHRANAQILHRDWTAQTDAQMADLATRYWAGLSAPDARAEILLIGDYEIVGLG